MFIQTSTNKIQGLFKDVSTYFQGINVEWTYLPFQVSIGPGLLDLTLKCCTFQGCVNPNHHHHKYDGK